MSDPVSEAAAKVEADAFILHPDCRRVRQTTAVEVVLRLLRLLDIPFVARVLEIGTGSGFSTALLANLAGDHGRVVSLDVDPALIDRARPLLAAHGLANTTLLTRDGMSGAAEHGPYDRIIAWTSPPHLPDAWVAQSSAGAMIVLPLSVAAVERSILTIRVCIDNHGRPHAQRAVGAAFIPMHGPQPPPLIALHRNLAAADFPDGDQPPRWISCPALNGHPGAASWLLETLTDSPDRTGPLTGDEDPAALRAYLLATDPPGLATANLDFGDWIGTATPQGAALLNLNRPTTHRTTGSPQAAYELRQCIEGWRTAGRPALDQLQPLLRKVPGGWRATLTNP